MLFRKADQIVDFQRLTVIEHGVAAIAPEHLVHLAEDEAQIRPRRWG